MTEISELRAREERAHHAAKAQGCFNPLWPNLIFAVA